MLEIRNLSAALGDKQILHDVSARFESGSVSALLGPNGSGKSTLGNAIMGRPDLTLSENAAILLDGEPLQALSPEERATRGIFLSFQSPLPIPGVSAMDVFRAALGGRMSALELHEKVMGYAEELSLDRELLKRSLYEGFSGGEKKKMEALQAVMFGPKVAIFDEIDTGVDVDALSRITAFLKKNLSEDSILIFITHLQKLLQAVTPDQVLILKGGRIVASGDQELAETVEERGFGNF